MRLLGAIWRRIATAAKVAFLPGDHTPVTRHELRQFLLDFDDWERSLTDILEKLNAWYARQAKRQKRALEAQLVDDASGDFSGLPAGRKSHKLALYRRAIGGGGSLGGGPPPPPDLNDGDDP